MKRKHKLKIIIMVILIILVNLTSCKPMNDEQKEEVTFMEQLEELKIKPVNEIPQHISLVTTEGFVIDAEVSISRELHNYCVPVIRMQRKLYENKEEVLNKLFKVTAWDKELLSNTESRVTDEKLENGQYESLINIVKSNDEKGVCFIQIRDRRLMIQNELENRYLFAEWDINPFVDTSISSSKRAISYLPIDKDLDFMTAKEAESYVRDICEDLGVEMMNTIVYSCSVDGLRNYAEFKQKYYDEIGWKDSIVDQNISKEDEAYCIVLQQGYKDIPIIPHELSRQITNTYYTASKNCALISEKGIQSLTISFCYNIEDTGEQYDILSLGDILQIHYERYRNVFEKREEVKEIKLYYVPVCTNKENLEFTAIPVWFFQSDVVIESSNGEDVMGRAVIYDAITGEELAW